MLNSLEEKMMRTVLVSLMFVATAAAAATPQDECRVVPRTPYDDPNLLRQMASIYLKNGLPQGVEFLQRASTAQQEIDLQERACAACANAGLPNGSLERSNCVADQVAKNRRPESAPPSFQPKRSVTCRKNAIDGSMTCTED